MAIEFHGVITPVITPFQPSLEVDEKRLRNHVRRLIESGVHGLVACGSTGEFALLSTDERRLVAEVVVDEADGLVPVIVGATAVGNAEAVGLARHAAEIGADGVLLAPSYYYVPTEAEVRRYFADVADVGLPTIAYNIPFTTKVDMSPEFLVRLAGDFENLGHVKEATGDMARVAEILRLSDGRVRVLCGADPLMYAFLSSDASGVISASSNVMPGECVELYELVLKSELEKAKALFYSMLEALTYLDAPKFVQNVKAALDILGHKGGPTRRPLAPLDQSELATLTRVLDDAQIKA